MDKIILGPMRGFAADAGGHSLTYEQLGDTVTFFSWHGEDYQRYQIPRPVFDRLAHAYLEEEAKRLADPAERAEQARWAAAARETGATIIESEATDGKQASKFPEAQFDVKEG